MSRRVGGPAVTLPEGVYEHLTTEELARRLTAATGIARVIEPLDDGNARDTFGRHVGSVIARAISGLPVAAADELIRKVLDHLASLVGEDVAELVRDEQPQPPSSRLMAVHRGAVPDRPTSPLASASSSTSMSQTASVATATSSPLRSPASRTHGPTTNAVACSCWSHSSHIAVCSEPLNKRPNTSQLVRPSCASSTSCASRSFSRPRVSNDNPFSEAQFKTLKYQPDYPGWFASDLHARAWLQDFFAWHNEHHHHAGLALFTPADVFHDRVALVAKRRRAALDAAYVAHPERFPNGQPRARLPPAAVHINPVFTEVIEVTASSATQPDAPPMITALAS